MTLLKIRNALAVFGLITTVAMVPTTASAKGSVHLDLHGLSIGYYDHGYRHHRAHKRKHLRRHHRRHHRNHYRKHYDRHYYNRHRDYGYRDYNHGYYDRGYHRKPRYYDRRDYCPIAGFSLYFYEDRGCYQHKGHYHCD